MCCYKCMALQSSRVSYRVARQLSIRPPTKAAVKYHSLRVYHQRGHFLNFIQRGWKVIEGKMIPLKTDLERVPKTPLEVIRCKCKNSCGKKGCECRGLGIDCTPACGECRGICENMRDVIDDNSKVSDL